MSHGHHGDDIGEFAALLSEPANVAPQRSAVAARRRRRGWIVFGVVFLVLGALVGTYLPLTLLATATGATVAVSQPAVVAQAAATITTPGIGASAVSVVGGAGFPTLAGGILASSGGDTARPMASISKLITALVVLDAKPINAGQSGPTITFSKADHDLYDKYYLQQAVIQPMPTGSSMSEREALEVMLVVSACNYAEALSTWAFGSQARFIAATKTWLTKNGLTGTRMVESTGLDARNTSTPTDLIALGRLALANPVVAEIVAAPTAQVPGLPLLRSSNSLLGVDGITGIKTGTLEDYSNLLFSAVVEVGGPAPVTVVGVVMGGADHDSVDAAVRALIASIKGGFHRVTVVTAGDAFGSYSTPWKDDARVVAGTTASVLVWSDTPVSMTVKTEPVTTGRSGTEVGAVTYTAGEATVSVPLVLDGAIDGPDGWWRVTHPLELLNG